MGILGGGGVSPTASDLQYPLALRMQHGAWLNNYDPDTVTFSNASTAANEMNMAEAMAAVSDYDYTTSPPTKQNSSPYYNQTAYDPSTDFSTVQTRYNTWDSDVQTASLSTVVPTAIGNAATEVDGDLIPTTEIDDAVNAYETRSKQAYLRSVSRATAGMFDARAVMTSQFGMMVANMEADRQAELNDVDAKMRLYAQRERTQSILNLTSEFLRQQQFAIQAGEASTAMQFDIKRALILAEQDKKEYDVEMDVRDTLWDLDLFAYGEQMLASLTGTPTVPRGLTPRERALGAFMRATSQGLQMGTALGSPQLGTLFGFLSLGAQLWAAPGAR